MNNNFSKKIGLVGIIGSLLGCSQDYPQYSGDYRLKDLSVEYSPEEFKGEKNWPEFLEVAHRMEYKGSGFNHYLGLNFKAENSSEAEGNMVFKLSKLTNEGKEAYPNDTPDGDHIYDENKIYGGAFCDSQVQYWVFAELSPDHKLLDGIYENHAGSAGNDPVTGMPRKISPNPERLEEQFNEKKADEWFDLAKNGLKIEIPILRNLESTTHGCYDFEGYLPQDKWGKAWSKATYFCQEEDADYETNLITAGLGDLDKFGGMPMTFFEQVIPDVGSTNKY